MLLLVDEVARTCNNLDQLVSTLEDHRLKQMAELEADLAARQEKIMGTWVESFTAMNKAKENGRLNEYTSQLVLLVNSFLNKNEFRQAKLWILLTFFLVFNLIALLSFQQVSWWKKAQYLNVRRSKIETGVNGAKNCKVNP